MQVLWAVIHVTAVLLTAVSAVVDLVAGRLQHTLDCVYCSV